MQTREERPVLVRLGHEGVGRLLEVEVNPDADRRVGPPGRSRAFVGGLHESWTTPGHDAAAHCGQTFGETTHVAVDGVAFAEARRSEDGHVEPWPLRRSQPGELVHGAPQRAERRHEHFDDLLLPIERDDLS